jgi:hypothetical protein
LLLKDFSRAVLQQAVALYLEEAYGGEAPPPDVGARLAWPAGETLESLADGGAFERVPPGVPVAECERLRLRLGSAAYPHTKLGLDHVPGADDWVLTVDSHDRLLLAAVDEAERPALEALLRRNAEVKARIERRWNEAGLPTFERYIRGRLASRGAGGAVGV